MSEEDKRFIENYEKLLDKGYCDCNEMNCIDNNSPRRILNIVKNLWQENQQLKELCDKYEEEHKKEFNTWVQGQKVLAELEESLKKELDIIKNDEFFCNFSNQDYIEFILDKIQKLKEKYK